jgi:hypothetical protein
VTTGDGHDEHDEHERADHDDRQQGDQLPEDLDVTAYVGPYTFPDIRRRRIPALLYLVVAAVSFGAGLAVGNGG